ncbi:phosphate:sodium symporter [Mangrovimonas yunxiaonensis]|uniref:Phosphate transporter n=1 Tax=Mangrovimonas yunxiaonensis TaxID=1197477 RepID=A0A084TMM8_9FLAO|nr:inorganic phosphate transporter [Mangrovimonas yunxiaonensis]KFB01964.1 phosphate:sodium symporter [Mangrovimonas yunxiaonensis]GGH45024.1 phosphate transporter [Mangrovimonas yunxiaonensis]
MENIYIYMLIALAVLAVADLVVGVSNDAVNFLNSAIGSKAVSFKTLMIVASLGVALGALSSSGMMEVARKGIFNPSEFMFNEIMIIFMAVMLTDILLLDFFNTLGLPTSTTVSIVFELLGASVAMALIKISADDSQTLVDIVNYINNEKAIEIILGILLSVVIAFSIGALVQFLSRIFLSFKFNEKPSWYGATFSGLAITSIMYFILIKGLKSAAFMSPDFLHAIQDNTTAFLAVNFAIWTLLSMVVIKVFKTNIYTLIIIIGTFALAMAFAGNDLVNFIGVPIAAYNSFEAWSASGMAPSEFSMGILAQKVPTQPYLLLVAGLVMVLTLWFSSKAKAVVKTSVDLSRQDDVKERFEPNFLSRNVVRLSMGLSLVFNNLLPNSAKQFIEKQFKKPVINGLSKNTDDLPAFDLVRAAVNLMVASVLISIATSMKLPLSTTYVTFMVAMGTSLADRAWGSESAVYRVAGVFNVIGGWFFTAISAFIAAAVTAYLLNWNVKVMVPVLLFFAIILLVRNYISHRNKSRESKAEDRLERTESSSVQGVIHESANNISNVVKRGNKIYTNAIDGLARQDLITLKKNKKQVAKLTDEIEDLRDNIFYFIKNLDEKSVSASNFYINILDYLTDMAQSLEYISKASHKHVNNNHKKLKFSQIKELKDLDKTMDKLFSDTQHAFSSYSFEKIEEVLRHKSTIYEHVTRKIQLQVERTRSEESSPKNTTLFFSVLLETKDLLDATFDLLEEYDLAHDASVKPFKITSDSEE